MNVMTVRLAAAASVWMVVSDVDRPASQGRIKEAKAGSPSHPRVSEASVMPSWLTER